MTRKALITGVTGQDGSYLAELLLEKGYEVHGLVRRSSTPNLSRIEHLVNPLPEHSDRLILHHGDLSDSSGLARVVAEVLPHEVYNLAAQSHVQVSFEQPEYTADVVGTGVLRLLEAVRRAQEIAGHPIHFYQASSSEMFGATRPPQSLKTPFHPRSPYAVAKVAAYYHTQNYRESYGMFAASGLLFNHESPRRGETFVTRKITRAVGRIKVGIQHQLLLGNLDARRDWGHARDYVRAMFMMLQQPEPRDYVIGTGEARSVREFADLAFGVVGLDYRQYVSVDPKFFRPAEVDYLLGDATDARENLGWQPTISFEQLVQEMVVADLELARREMALVDAGHAISQGDHS